MDHSPALTGSVPRPWSALVGLLVTHMGKAWILRDEALHPTCLPENAQIGVQIEQYTKSSMQGKVWVQLLSDRGGKSLLYPGNEGLFAGRGVLQHRWSEENS